MKSSFSGKRNATPAKPAQAASAKKAPTNAKQKSQPKLPESTTDETVATRSDQTVGAAMPQHDDMAGHYDRSDVRLPRINLIHKTSKGELIEQFGIGALVFEKSVKLSDGKTPIIVTAVRYAKDYQQKLPFGSDQTPATFKTPEEVISNGGSLNYADLDSGNFFQPRGHLQLLIPLPEDADEADEALFPYEYEGKVYGMGIITVASSAYTSVGKEIATLRNNNRVMREGLRYGSLALTSEDRSGRGKEWKVPVIKFLGANDPEFVKWIESVA